MKNLIFAIAVVAVCAAGCTSDLKKGGSCAAECRLPAKPLKVLMIGNSFSICVLRYMPQVAADLELPLDICSLCIGGCTLNRHHANIKTPEKTPYRVNWSYVSCAHDSVPFLSVLKKGKKGKNWFGNIPAMLTADKWDVVTIQQASHESWIPETYEPHGTELIELIGKLAPQAKIYVQQTWSYTPWNGRLEKWGFDQNQMFDKLEAAYAGFAARHKLDLIYTGKAVQRYRKELPVVYTENSNADDVCGVNEFVVKNGKWVMKGDNFHLNACGEFLQALVWTARLFDADVTKSSYVPPCLAKHPERAALMREIAAELR